MNVTDAGWAEDATGETEDESWKNASRSQSPFSELPLEVELGASRSSENKSGSFDVTTPTFDTFGFDLEDDDNSSPYTCDLCGRAFPNILGLKTHKRSHRRKSENTTIFEIPANKVPIERERNRRDTRLKQTTPSLPRREAPVNSVSAPELGHSCGQCVESYTCGSDLHAHVTRVHGPQFEDRSNRITPRPQKERRRSKLVETYWRDGLFYVCKYCGKSYLHIVGFRSHWRRHERENGVSGDTLMGIAIPTINYTSDSFANAVTLPLIDMIE